MVKQAMKKKSSAARSTFGGTLTGFVVGLLVGLGLALSVAVYVTLTMPVVILQESFLSFIGLGVRPPDAPLYLARSLIDRDGQTWQELDLQALVNEPEFLAIAA